MPPYPYTPSSVVPSYGQHHLSLSQLCQHVDRHRSLQEAEIITIESCAENSNGVTHRFLILKLRRQGRKDAWLRLDRRRGGEKSFLAFLFGEGETAANDVAEITANKEDVVGRAHIENCQVFTAPPTLGLLRRLLGIIVEEMVSYKVWPENCWFFCSLIQELLGGSFAAGTLQHGYLASDIRKRVAQRFWSETRISAPVQPPEPALAPLSQPQRQPKVAFDLTRQPRRRNTLGVSRPEENPGPIRRRSSLSAPKPRTQTDVASLRALAASLRATSKFPEAISVERDALHIMRRLHDQDPTTHRHELAVFLNEHGDHLRATNLRPEACTTGEESVSLLRQLCQLNPTQSRSYEPTLALYLHKLGGDYRATQHPRRACAAHEEAATLRRQLHQDHATEETCAALADSLQSYSADLYELTHYSEALAASKEAVELRRQLYAADPGVYCAGFAAALYDHSFDLRHAGRFRHACVPAQHAAELRRYMYQINPQTKTARADLIHTLTHLSACLVGAGRDADAAAIDKELAAVDSVG